jgi:hypothetical protein
MLKEPILKGILVGTEYFFSQIQSPYFLIWPCVHEYINFKVTYEDSPTLKKKEI